MYMYCGHSHSLMYMYCEHSHSLMYMYIVYMHTYTQITLTKMTVASLWVLSYGMHTFIHTYIQRYWYMFVTIPEREVRELLSTWRNVAFTRSTYRVTVTDILLKHKRSMFGCVQLSRLFASWRWKWRHQLYACVHLRMFIYMRTWMCFLDEDICWMYACMCVCT
jgi:hypothetical protein